MKRKFIYKLILGVAIPLVGLVVIVASNVCRTHANLLDQGGFVQSSKIEVVPNVYLYRTSGHDVMLADEEGWGLLDGNIQQYAAIGDTIYLSYVKRGEKAVSFGAYVTKSRTFRELTTNEIERRGIRNQWKSVP